MSTSLKIKLAYSEIPEISPDDVWRLNNKRSKSALSDLELAQLEKFHFCSLLFDKNPKIRKELWPIFLDHGKTEFFNLLNNNKIILK